MRRTNGETVYNVRHETQIENVMGRRNSWWRSGKDWCAWNATFGPRGDDGQPKPLWAAKTGEIDRSVVEFWKQKDLRLCAAIELEDARAEIGRQTPHLCRRRGRLLPE